MDVISGNNTRLCKMTAHYAETSEFIYRCTVMGDEKIAKTYQRSFCNSCERASLSSYYSNLMRLLDHESAVRLSNLLHSKETSVQVAFLAVMLLLERRDIEAML